MIVYAEAMCRDCDWETVREENGSGLVARWSREHRAENPSHTVYVEQGRLVIYRPEAGA